LGFTPLAPRVSHPKLEHNLKNLTEKFVNFDPSIIIERAVLGPIYRLYKSAILEYNGCGTKLSHKRRHD